MSTISSIPNELLIEIFKSYLVLPSESNFHGDTRFLLAAVCHRWRDVVLKERSLWTTININARSVIPRPISDINVPPGTIFFRACIALFYAGGLPVNLTIEVPDAPTPCFNELHAQLLSTILKHEAPRIASLKICGNYWPMQIDALVGLFQQPMPLLETFSHVIWQDYEIRKHTRFEIFQDYSYYDFCMPPYDPSPGLAEVNKWGQELYPNLKDIEISGAPYDFENLPTTGLRKLALCNQPEEECPPSWQIREMLSFAADTLEELCLPGFLPCPTGNEDEDIHVPNPVILPNLKRLSFAYEDPNEVTNFLPSIRTPALKRLNIADTFTAFQADRDASVIPTDHMFKAMMQYLPVQQLERLDIEHVVFEDKIAIPELDATLIEGKVLSKDVPFTQRFLESLTSLKHLEYWVADERLLSLLDYPVTPSFGKDGQALHDGAMQVPSRHLAYLPTLDTLHLHGHAAEICPFVDIRARVHSTVRKPIPIVVNRTVEMLDAILEYLDAHIAAYGDDHARMG